MSRYLLSVHMADDDPTEPRTDEEMGAFMEQVSRLEAEMQAQGAFVFGGRLDQPARARVVRATKGRVRAVDGPFAETKEHVGGFYLIDAADDDEALAWASKVTLAINAPIELRAFVAESKP